MGISGDMVGVSPGFAARRGDALRWVLYAVGAHVGSRRPARYSTARENISSVRYISTVIVSTLPWRPGADRAQKSSASKLAIRKLGKYSPGGLIALYYL